MLITPNQLTTLRIALVPAVALFLAVGGPMASTFGLICFIIAALSDWLDGHLARKHNMHSTIGRVFDPIADKLLVTAALLALAYTGKLAGGLFIPAIVIALREVFVSGLRESVSQLMLTRSIADSELVHNKVLINPELLSSTQIAKLKNVVQCVGIACLIPADYLFAPFLGLMGGAILWVAAALTVFTGWQYWQQAKGHLLVENKKGRNLKA